jgi:hypothetical protein
MADQDPQRPDPATKDCTKLGEDSGVGNEREAGEWLRGPAAADLAPAPPPASGGGEGQRRGRAVGVGGVGVLPPCLPRDTLRW